VAGGKLTAPGGATYEVLVLPERDDVDPQVLRSVEQLVRQGAMVIGKKPLRSSGYAFHPSRDAEVQSLAAKIWGNCDGRTVKQVKYGRGIVACGLTPREALRQRGVGPDFQFESGSGDADLDFIHRSLPSDAEIYMVRNKKKRQELGMAEFRVKGRQPELWDAVTGEIGAVREFVSTDRGTRLRVRLEPEGSAFVVFRKPGAPKARARAAPSDSTASLLLPGPWTVKFMDGPAAPPSVTLSALRSWTESSDPREKYFSGVAEYETEFILPKGWIGGDRRVTLDLGEMWAVAEVRLNGRDLGVLWNRPFRADISAAAREGSNRLVVRVANNWVNRLVGDALGLGPKVTRTNVTTTGVPSRAWREVELRPSGLMGPVQVKLHN
jgi:hypothetical protein